MKYKWLLVMACALMTACNGAKEDDKKDDKQPAADKSASVEQQDKDEEVAADSTPDQTKSEETASTQEPESLEEETVLTLDEISKNLDEARKKFMADYSKASAEEKQKLAANYPTGMDFVDDVKKIAEDNPKTDTAAAAYVWLVNEAGQDQGIASEALDKLFADHMDSEKMSDVAMSLARMKPSQELMDRYDTLIKNSPHKNVQGAATYAKVNFIKQMEMYKDAVDNPSFQQFMGKEGVEFVKNLKIDDGALKKMYQSIVDDFADVEVTRGPRKMKIAESAAAAIFEMENLAIGCTAPEIVGNDLDGTEFKLSDYRGKVVMLDFWGDW